MNFKINSRPLFTIIFKLKKDNFKARDFSPLIERVLDGVSCLVGNANIHFNQSKNLNYFDLMLIIQLFSSF